MALSISYGHSANSSGHTVRCTHTTVHVTVEMQIHVGPIIQTTSLTKGTYHNCPSEIKQYRLYLYRPTLYNGLVQGFYMHSFRPHHCTSAVFSTSYPTGTQQIIVAKLEADRISFSFYFSAPEKKHFFIFWRFIFRPKKTSTVSFSLLFSVLK